MTLTSQLIHQSLTLGVGPHGMDRPQYLSPSIGSSKARFKFLTLAVQLLRGRLVASAMDRTLLREKVYNAALDYFWLVIYYNIVYCECIVYLVIDRYGL